MVGRQGKNAIIAGCLKALGWRREYPELRQLPVPGETHESPDRPTPTTVRLAKLKLAGFKTFVDPTIVLTPGNLVGVVTNGLFARRPADVVLVGGKNGVDRF